LKRANITCALIGHFENWLAVRKYRIYFVNIEPNLLNLNQKEAELA